MAKGTTGLLKQTEKKQKMSNSLLQFRKIKSKKTNAISGGHITGAPLLLMAFVFFTSVNLRHYYLPARNAPAPTPFGLPIAMTTPAAISAAPSQNQIVSGSPKSSHPRKVPTTGCQNIKSPAVEASI